MCFAVIGTWYIVYEGTYSSQDVEDDLKAGIMSLAVGHRRHAKTYLGTAAAVQVALLGVVGILIGAGPFCFPGACVEIRMSLEWILWSVGLRII